MNVDTTRPQQVSSGGLLLTYFPDRHQFSLCLRERELQDGLVLPSRQITFNPARIAASKDPERFADMLETAARMIRNLID